MSDPSRSPPTDTQQTFDPHPLAKRLADRIQTAEQMIESLRRIGVAEPWPGSGLSNGGKPLRRGTVR
jgi:hypothetical protein